MDKKEAIRIAKLSLTEVLPDNTVIIPKEALEALIPNDYKCERDNSFNDYKTLRSSYFYEEYHIQDKELPNWWYTTEKIDWKDL